jgi:phosphoserine phosphatase
MLGAAGLGIAYHAKPAVQEAVDVAINHGGLDAALQLFDGEPAV